MAHKSGRDERRSSRIAVGSKKLFEASLCLENFEGMKCRPFSVHRPVKALARKGGSVSRHDHPLCETAFGNYNQTGNSA